MSPDFFNGLFEFCGALFILNHCRTLHRDKLLKGVSILSTTFFTCWGFWNIYYYPSLGQWWSFSGGLCIVTTNSLWIAMALYYRAKERRQAGLDAFQWGL